ncbi:hypothetical protein CGT77_03405 [Vibrio cholerae]|uniref:hypothetical protein n=1 Tax=Vibrio cholerae TaxID=666 RepID=UPI0006E701B0|nr:hypothetical protein [Vibrio cholerae]KQA50418.1 hypothetical protein XV77_08060 [Vibrio cholerae]KQA63778.1 hypothetical protein XV80_02650 [Vibrio cholerae]KQA72938.1 hypothetical protein XV83_04155 [Vibrio cholerae]PAS10028.1 hypothetical protein CGT77_03405 [Vibrio cholerae]PAS14112.1 hypothetical protein CGT75_17110 [Vibrio cholerae]
MNDKKVNYFVRCLIVGLAAFIVWIISYSLLSPDSKGAISAGMITLVILLVVIVLSETFDQFSVGKIFSLSKEVAKKNGSIVRLKNENTELRKELVNVVTSINQHQTSTNIIGVSPADIAKAIGVEKATPDEITEKRTEEIEEIPERVRPIRRIIDHRKLEEVVFNNFLKTRNLTNLDLIREAKLVTQFSGIDAITNTQPIYDGYINTGESEIFIEIKIARASTIMIRERVYLMLNKIFLYNKIKNANAHLNLILVDIGGEDDDRNRIQRNFELLKEFFEPSILRGLLRIVPMSLSEVEREKIYKEI